MKSKLIVIVIFTFLFMLQACGTIRVVSVDADRESFEKDKTVKINNEGAEHGYGEYSLYQLCSKTPNIYGGTVFRFRSILYPCIHTHGEGELAAMIFVLPINFVFSIIDLPFSAVADTVILPYTTYRQIKFGNACDGYGRCSQCNGEEPFTASFSGLGYNCIRVFIEDDYGMYERCFKPYGVNIPQFQDNNYRYRILMGKKILMNKESNSYMMNMQNINSKVSVQAVLLQNGLASVDESSCKKPVCDEWKKIEKQAKLNRIGFWNNLSEKDIADLNDIYYEETPPQNIQGFKDPYTGIEFVFVKGGCFKMGDPLDYIGNKAVHEVCVSDFYMSKYEITQAQWELVMGNNPSKFKNCGKNCPVENVEWDDVSNFIKKLNAQTGEKYCLPTEAEWEYACRSGGKDNIFSGSNKLDSVGWYNDNSNKTTHPVGEKKPNGLGIYDMSGNVMEWVYDLYDTNYFNISPRDNPAAHLKKYSRRTVRGGAYNRNPSSCSSTFRWYRSDDSYSIGFRLIKLTGKDQ
jgi:formylglycine-generating enzyme